MKVMKKIMYFAAALLVLAGCRSSQEARENAPAEVSTITGTIALPQEPNKISAPIGWESAIEAFRMDWEYGDKIYIFTKSDCKELTLKSIDKTTGKATFEGELLSNMESYSVAYGYDPNSTEKTFTVPYVEDNYHPFADGAGAEKAFTISNFGPVLGLKLKGTDALSKIVVVLSDNANTLATYTMTLNALQLDATDVANVYFPIKSITGATKMSISFYKTENETDVLIMTKTTTNITQVAAGKVTTFKELTVAPTRKIVNGHEAVQLWENGPFWATCNVGATNPEGYGDYFAWGETEPKDDYSWSTYFDTKDGGSTFTKYCGGKTDLDPEDDAASFNWGGAWRMPTEAEFTELENNCDYAWTDNYNNTGVKGCIFTNKTNSANYIFLPAAGYFRGTSHSNAGSYGYYWSSSLDTGNSSYGRGLGFHSGSVAVNYNYRCYGLSVRPVCQ